MSESNAVSESSTVSESSAVSEQGVSSVPEGSSVIEASAPSSDSSVLAAQGLTDISEADLRGPSTTEYTAPSEPKVKETTEKDTEVLVTKEDEVILSEVEESVPVKAPKGFVPLSALHEVRGENKYLKEELARLSSLATETAELDNLDDGALNASEFDDFVELTEAEFTLLAEDAPVDALKYMNKLNAYNAYVQQTQYAVQQDAINQEYLSQVYAEASREMEEAVPGLFDVDSEASTEFRDFALSVGFDESMFYLTNPMTRIILPGDTKPVVLGEHAAQIIKVLAQARSLASKPSEGSVDLVAIKESMRKEIEAEVMSKIKAGTSFRSLNSVPDSGETRPEFADTVLSEAAFLKLSPKEQEMYLAGQ